MRDVLAGYAETADPALIDSYDTLDPELVYASVLDLLPGAGARVADIGAGTGRDAAWLVERGCTVLAVEPVRELREGGRRLHRSKSIEWLDDRLPDLAGMRASGPFDAVILCAVWHHLDAADRALAMPNLAAAMAKGATLILSLRHQPGALDRGSFQVAPDETIAAAGACGLTLRRRREADSVSAESRALGVRWTWLVFEKP
ncbi:MAG: class I SAM-dependent methyltransferase [Sphingomonadales bacterium]|nr:MAG: class I SAM-dependent methyltransferase [Sphingomonadales bacterium]